METFPIKGIDRIGVTEHELQGNLLRAPKGGKQPFSSDTLRQMQDVEQTMDAIVASGVDNAQWVWPLVGTIVLPYSMGNNNGIDILGKAGDVIAAAGDGRVVYAGTGVQTNGKLIILRHSSDYFSFYSHTGEVLAVEGQSVTRGQKIAELGDREPASTNLHFEIHFQGRPVDPQKYLPPR